MPRRAIPSTTLVQAVRRYLGLEQQELASWLGVSRAMISHLEAGRKALPARVLLRLNPLAALLPADAPARPAPPVPEQAPPGPPAPGPLEARFDYCQHRAAKLRRELQQLAATQARARRWLAVLPGLLAAPVAPPDLVSPAEAARARQWLLARQQASHATLHNAEEAARYHLLRLRAEALETEAAGLAALLGKEATPRARTG